MAAEVWSVCTYERVYHRYNIWLQKYGLYVHMNEYIIGIIYGSRSMVCMYI